MTKKKDTTIGENLNDWDEQIKAFPEDNSEYFKESRYVDKGVTYSIPVNPRPEGEYRLEELFVFANEEDTYRSYESRRKGEKRNFILNRILKRCFG